MSRLFVLLIGMLISVSVLVAEISRILTVITFYLILPSLLSDKTIDQTSSFSSDKMLVACLDRTGLLSPDQIEVCPWLKHKEIFVLGSFSISMQSLYQRIVQVGDTVQETPIRLIEKIQETRRKASFQQLEVESEHSGTGFQPTSKSCPTSQPTKPVLVILLDQSCSLIEEPRAIDPNHYSTSVTKVLADRWPGKMAVIPFKGDTIPLKQIGSYAMTDSTQRDDLKNQISEADPNGDTPLGQAMDQALQLTKGTDPGSKVVVITDGEPNTRIDPDGSLEATHIRHDLLKQFCHQEIVRRKSNIMKKTYCVYRRSKS